MSSSCRRRRRRRRSLSASPAHPSSSTSQARPRRSTRLAAQARQRSSAADSTVAAATATTAAAPQDSRPLDPAKQFGLTGLTVLPIPDIEDIAATVQRHAEERYNQLLEGSSTQETLIYYNATTSHIDAIHSANPDRIYPGRITFFGNESGLLFFRMALPVHEVAHILLYDEVRDLVSQMGLRKIIVPVGSANYKGIGTRGKQGDSGIRPDPPRWAGNHFPSLVIEAGNSESFRRLYMDKDWWFDNSPLGQPQGDVRIVLLVKVERQTRRILVEQWYRSQLSPSQTIIIMPHPDKPFSLHDSRCWVVEGAPMVIPFEHVFLRPKQGGREMDIVLTEPFCATMGMQCWKSNTRI